MVSVGFILLIIAGVSKAIMDTINFHYYDSIFYGGRFNRFFWNPSVSYLNKYKDFNGLNKIPRFFGSTTFLVWTTDAWHLFQMIKQITLTVGMLILGFYSKEWWDLTLFWVLGYIVYTSIFELFFSKIFK